MYAAVVLSSCSPHCGPVPISHHDPHSLGHLSLHSNSVRSFHRPNHIFVPPILIRTTPLYAGVQLQIVLAKPNRVILLNVVIIVVRALESCKTLIAAVTSDLYDSLLFALLHRMMFIIVILYQNIVQPLETWHDRQCYESKVICSTVTSLQVL